MSRSAKILIAAVAIAAGAGVFLATVGWGEGRPAQERPLARWLQLTAEQAEAVDQADPKFAAQAADLETMLRQERDKLATLLEDPESPNDKIMEQVERVIFAHDALERRAAEHVLTIRPKLTSAQQKRLMGLCAQGVREAAGRGWQGGRGEGGAGGGKGRGQGGPPWQGGRGQGKGGGGPRGQ